MFLNIYKNTKHFSVNLWVQIPYVVWAPVI